MWLNQAQLDVIGGVFHKSKSTGGNYNNYIQSRTYDDGNLYYSDLRSDINSSLVSNVGYDYSNSVTNNEWFHYVLAFNGNGATNEDRIKMYIDGQQVTGVMSSSQDFQATTFDLTGSDFILGQCDPLYFTGAGWNGKIDDIYIYSGLLTLAQIDSLKNTANPVVAENSLNELPNNVFSIFPNPSSSNVKIVNNSNEIISKIEIYSAIGNKVLTVDKGNFNEVSLENLNSGIYTLKITSENSEQKIKVIKL